MNPYVIYVLLTIVIGVLAMLLVVEKQANKASEEVVQAAKSLVESTRRAAETERQLWIAERDKLLDRIQAPSFESYKQAEIKLTKVQNGVKDPPTLEQL